MDRADRLGLGLAIVGHAALVAVLSLAFLQPKAPPPPKPQPIEVSLVPDVALEAKAPQAVVPPTHGEAPEVGPPEEAPPPPPAPEPRPEPAPPKPEPAKVTPPKPAPAPKPKPAPAPKPEPKPAPKPEPKPAPKPAEVTPPRPKPKPAKPVPAKPAPEKAQEKPTPAKAAPAKAAPAKAAPSRSAITRPTLDPGEGKTAAAKPARPRGSHLGPDFLKDLSTSETKSTAQAPQAARIDAAALAGIIGAIARQIQPCADRQVNPGPGANQISVKLNLRLNRDGTLAATPTMVGSPSGVTDENDRYVQRVRDLGIAAFKGCSPLKLPAEFYQTANGGWSNINYTWKLR